MTCNNIVTTRCFTVDLTEEIVILNAKMWNPIEEITSPFFIKHNDNLKWFC